MVFTERVGSLLFFHNRNMGAIINQCTYVFTCSAKLKFHKRLLHFFEIKVLQHNNDD